jgi:hypothetical protein
MLRQHAGADRAACPEQEDAHRRGRDAELFGYIGGRLAAHVDELEDLPLTPRELDVIGLHETRQTGGIGIRAGVLRLGASFNRRPLASLQLCSAAFPPQTIEGDIPCHSVQPAAESASPVELRHAGVKSHEDQLRDVLGLVVVRGQSPRPSTHAFMHTSGELLESSFTPAAHPGDEDRKPLFLGPLADESLRCRHSSETVRVVAAFMVPPP